MIRIVDARYRSGYVIWLQFSDGLTGEVDLAAELEGEAFEPLRDRWIFQSFVVHPERHTIVWPNGADLAPEFLYDLVRVHA